jgi:hypothetical protein
MLSLTPLWGGDRHGVSEGEMTADGRINAHLVSNYHMHLIGN